MYPMYIADKMHDVHHRCRADLFGSAVFWQYACKATYFRHISYAVALLFCGVCKYYLRQKFHVK